MENCRICGKKLSRESLMDFSAQPRGAQELPCREKPDTGVDFSVKRCAYCGVVQLDSMPVPYFREVIRTAGLSEEMKHFRRQEFSSFVKKYALEGKMLLECGCGAGEYMTLMQECKVFPYGMDGSRKNMEKCLSCGLKGEVNYFESGEEKISSGAFDGFYILNYLEHIPDIPRYLKGIWNNLKAGSVGLVEVPDFAMMLEKDFFAEFIPDHLYYFTAESLKNTLEANGFKVLSVENIFHSYILSMTVQKKSEAEMQAFCHADAKYESLDLSGMKKAKEKFIEEFKMVLAKGGKCAIWGASHQTFSILAFLCEENRVLMKEKLLFIADSAPFKQGKITPATHFDIVEPQKLLEEKIDTLIVIGGGYSDEISRIAKNTMRFGGSIYILRASGLEKAV